MTHACVTCQDGVPDWRGTKPGRVLDGVPDQCSQVQSGAVSALRAQAAAPLVKGDEQLTEVDLARRMRSRQPSSRQCAAQGC